MGSSSTRTGPGASRARATARRRRSPPDRATPSSPTGVSSPWGSAATQVVEAGGAQRVGDLLPRSASGRPRTRLDRTVPANSCARWSASAQAARASAWRSCSHVGAAERQRAVLERPVAQERGDEARLAGAARAGHGHPAAGRQPQAHPVEGAGKAGVVAQGGVGEGHLGHARRPAATGRPGRRPGPARPRARRGAAAAARTSSERATASGDPRHRLEGGQRGQREHGHHDLAEMMGVDGGHAGGQHGRHGDGRGRPE